MSYKRNDLAKKRYRSICARNIEAESSLDEKSFLEWYGDDARDRRCHYCGILESEIRKMIAEGKIQTKRLTTRGRHMEVDRIDPLGGYTMDNIVLSCYWCNNAKSDEFSEEEFREIAKGIHAAWTSRKKRPLRKRRVLLAKRSLLREFDPPRGVVFALPYCMVSVTNPSAYAKILKKLTEAVLEHTGITVYLLYADKRVVVEPTRRFRESLGQEVMKSGRIHFLPVARLEDVWVRDYMPIALKNRKGLKAVYAPIYYEDDRLGGKKGDRKYAVESHFAGIEVAQRLGVAWDYLSKHGGGYWYEGLKDEKTCDFSFVDGRPIILDGGNLIHNGSVGFVSARLITENLDEDFYGNETDGKKVNERMQHADARELLTLLRELLGLEELFVLPVERTDSGPEATGHLDGTLRFLDEKTLLVDEAYYRVNRECFDGLGIHVETVKQSYDVAKEGSATGVVLNYLRLGDTIFAPYFTKHPDQEAVKHRLRELCEARGIRLVWVNEDGGISKLGGVFNCISWVF